MKKTWAVLKHEFRQTLRQKSYLLMVIGVPLLAIVGYGVAQAVQHWGESETPKQVRVGYVDQAGLISEETSPTDVEFVPYPNDAEAKAALLRDEIDEYFILPQEYVATGTVVRFTPKGETKLSDKVSEAIKGLLLTNMLAGHVSEGVLERTKAPMAVASFGLDKTGAIAPETDDLNKIFVPMLFALLFVMSVFVSSGFMLQSVSEEKENRVMEVLLSSVSARQLLTGKVLGLGAAALLQIVVWLVTLKLFAGVASVNIAGLEGMEVSASVIMLGLLYFLLGFMLFAALMAGIGSIG
jgi:ABC-2 type transport system permease protein